MTVDQQPNARPKQCGENEKDANVFITPICFRKATGRVLRVWFSYPHPRFAVLPTTPGDTQIREPLEMELQEVWRTRPLRR